MIFRIACLAIVLVIVSTRQATPATVDLVWDPAVPGDPHESSFDCDTDEGSHDLIVHFSISGTDSIEANALEMVINYGAESEIMPAWWSGPSQHSLTVVPEFLPGPYLLADFWRGRGTVDHLGWGWESRYHDPRPGAFGGIYVRLSMPAESHTYLQPGTSYYAFRLRISHEGASSVPGCAEGICFVPRVLCLERANVAVECTGWPFASYSDARWQGGFPDCLAAVPVVQTTWSGIKSRFR